MDDVIWSDSPPCGAPPRKRLKENKDHVERNKSVYNDETGEFKNPSDDGCSSVTSNDADVKKDPKKNHCGLLEGCRTITNYERLNRIASGTYGSVYRARCRSTGKIVALKQLKYHASIWEEGFPLMSLREIAILQELGQNCPYIVRLIEVVVGDRNPNDVFLVMEYVEHELRHLLQKPFFSAAEKKTLFLQLIEAVGFCHRRWVIHRDLKPSNILYSNHGCLKLCDFGMARKYGDPLHRFTSNVSTLWYRAPELLYNPKGLYSTAVDMWGVGCVIAEVVLRKPLFRDTANEKDLLEKIFDLCGSPEYDDFSELYESPVLQALFAPKTLVPGLPSKWRTVFPAQRAHISSEIALCDVGLNLLQGLLCLNPAKRLTAEEALNHPFFKTEPWPRRPQLMPTKADSNNTARELDPTNGAGLRRNRLHQDDGGLFGAERIDAQEYLKLLNGTSAKA